MRKISLAVFLWLCFITVTAQRQYSKAVNEQIARVEANLSGGIVVFVFHTFRKLGIVHFFVYLLES